MVALKWLMFQRSRSVKEEPLHAEESVRLQRETLNLIASDQIAKGNVFATARIAGSRPPSKLRNSFRFVILCRSAK